MTRNLLIKSVLLFAILCISNINAAFAQNDILCWDERSLTWDDFKGIVEERFNRPGMQLAITDARIRYAKSEETGKFEVNTIFDRQKSWMVGRQTPAGLVHEQLHFDIAEVYARKMRQYISKNSDKSDKKIIDRLKKIMAENEKMQGEYDTDVQMSGKDRVEQQKVWNKKISDLLKKSDAHKSSGPCTVPELSKSEKDRILTTVSDLVRENLVVEDLAKKTAAAILANQKGGKYQAINTYAELANVVTQDLRDTSGDLHLYLREVETTFGGPQQSGPQVPGTGRGTPGTQTQRGSASAAGARRVPGGSGERSFDRFRNDEGKIISHKLLEGDVLYIHVAMFAPFEVVKDELKEALEASKNADAIIVDLRDCPGGMGESMEYLAGGFVENRTLLSKHYQKEGGFESYTTETPYGKINNQKPVIALTSQRSFSAAEAFAFFMQEAGRVQVAGVRTKGGGRTTEMYSVNERLNISISNSVAVSSKGNEFQGVGVIPDFPSSEENALTVGHAEALKLVSGKHGEKKRELAPIIEVLEQEAVNREKARIEEIKVLESYSGKYGIRTIAISEGGIVYRKEGQDELGLKKIGVDTYKLIVPDNMIDPGNLPDIRFDRGKNGKVISFSLITADGSVQETFKKES